MKIPYPLKPFHMWKMRLLFPPLFHILTDGCGYFLAPRLVGGWYGSNWSFSDYFPEYLLGTAGMYVITECNFWTYYAMDRIFPWEKDCTKRLLVQLAFSIIFSIGAAVMLRSIIPWMLPGHSEAGIDSLVILTGLTSFTLSVVFLGLFVFHRMSASLLEAEQLKQENLIAQNQALRQQIDPHFLFNSITTLTTLIEENKDLAVEFVHRLARVYRHVLKSKEHDLVDLKTEIEFVRDYAFAFEMRFGAQFRLTIGIPDRVLTSLIPPLTLQILVENAVKHNVISGEQPLLIHIGLEGDSRVVVRNSLRRKQSTSSPTHIGLNNIMARYKLLSHGIVEVIEEKDEFIVKLPLVKA